MKPKDEFENLKCALMLLIVVPLAIAQFALPFVYFFREFSQWKAILASAVWLYIFCGIVMASKGASSE